MREAVLAWAGPFFFVLLVGEWWLARRARKPRHTLQDSLSNLACGVGNLVVGVAFQALLLGMYTWVFSQHRLWTLPAKHPLVWGLCLLGCDFCYYWFHRSSHRCNVLWAAHAVHHQSEEYNLTTALRQSWLEPLFATLFYLPLALLGFAPGMFFTLRAVHVLTQFWLHTQLIGSLGPAEWLLNTPSHHRVHHGTQAGYLDKNYGGMLIVWDRVFGTFAQETAPPHYGTVQPLQSWNPLWANTVEWFRLVALARRSKGLFRSFQALFAAPEWDPSSGPRKVSTPAARSQALPAKYGVSAAPSVLRYSVLQFALGLLGSVAFVRWHASLPWPLDATVGLWLLLALCTPGALQEARPWAAAAERIKLWTCPIWALALGGRWACALGLGYALASELHWGRWRSGT